MNQVKTRVVGGEYSTVALPGGYIETMFFGDDGSHRRVGYVEHDLKEIHKLHVQNDEGNDE